MLYADASLALTGAAIVVPTWTGAYAALPCARSAA